MKIFGHPIHIMLIHFPSALFPMDLVCYFLYYYYGNTAFAQASFFAMAGGVILGWTAVMFGALDLTGISAKNEVVMKKALIHGGINATVVIVYTVLAYSVSKKYPESADASLPLLIVKFLTVNFMIVGNYIGGSLILKHKVGIEE